LKVRGHYNNNQLIDNSKQFKPAALEVYVRDEIRNTPVMDAQNLLIAN